MRKPREKTAKFIQVLEYVDGPQAVLLELTADAKVVAVAIEREGQDYPFFGAEISSEQWERYRRGFVDLRYLFMYPRGRHWYYFDLNKQQDGKIRLELAERNDHVIQEYIPEAGFFAYDHSEPIKEDIGREFATQKYKTDGIWDLPDFTHFYSKLTDLYSFFLCLKKYPADDTPPDLKKRIRTSFREHPLRGGSSYVNMYGDFASVQRPGDRLAVGQLRYASAGQVDVKGRYDIFTELAVSLNEFIAHYDEIRTKHNELKRFLSKNKLLKADKERFDKDGPLAKHIYDESMQFANMLRLLDTQLVYELTDKNALSFAKVLLAHFRRLERYFMFFAEGRVKEPETIAG